MMKIDIKMKLIDGVMTLVYDNENVSDYVKERLDSFFEKKIKDWMDTGLYDLSTFTFEASDENIKFRNKLVRMSHGLELRFKIIDGDASLYTSWDGKREMKWDSKELISEFEADNGPHEVLRLAGFNIQTIRMKIKTITKFY